MGENCEIFLKYIILSSWIFKQSIDLKEKKSIIFVYYIQGTLNCKIFIFFFLIIMIILININIKNSDPYSSVEMSASTLPTKI